MSLKLGGKTGNCCHLLCNEYYKIKLVVVEKSFQFIIL